MSAARHGAVALAVALLCLPRPPAAGGEAPAVPLEARAPAPDDLQRGLFLQHTAGDLDAALAAYGAALEGRAPGAGTDELLGLRTECLAWRGDGPGLAAALEELRRSAATQPGLEALRDVPAGADVVAMVELERLRGVPWGEALLAARTAELERELRPRLGFGLRELRRLTLALDLTDGARALDGWLLGLQGELSGASPEALLRVLAQAWRELAPGLQLGVRGSPGTKASLELELSALREASEEPGPVVRERLGELELFLVPSGLRGAEGREERLGALRLDAATLLVGEERCLRRALQVRALQAPGLQANPRLWGLARRVHPEAGLWLLAVPQALAAQVRQVELDPSLRGGVLGLAGLLLQARLGAELELDALAFAEDAQSVRILADLARGGLALLRLATGDEAAREPVLAALLAGLELQAEGRELSFRLRLPRDLLGRLSLH
ncbi:MAG TPA: hypothetical protein PK668_01000 [Myxococcota bacterium]|nr:hypothetical protein [Myxococcota bacterium]HRY96678.1 hypothetical protein [Myxococcota bacterium]HSA20584.1 hypothetical protein [Myxococcota bacterium]